MLVSKSHANLHHLLVNLLLDPGYPSGNGILSRSCLVLPHLQSLKLQVVLQKTASASASSRAWTSFSSEGASFGGAARVDLPLKGGV